MAVNFKPMDERTLYAIAGLELSVAEAGVKYPNRKDLLVMSLEKGATVAGVFTQNRFCAAPVQICQSHLASGAPTRALVVNTGNANAGTGAEGRQRALSICTTLADEFDCDVTQILPFSTGVILEPLPADRIIQALDKRKKTSWGDAAHAIMTTDTQPKACSRKLMMGGVDVTITGIAKGSGMIQPNMATMLGFIATDAAITRPLLEQLVKEISDESFNCISVDGDCSTNDSFILIATGKSAAPLIESADGTEYRQIRQALAEVAILLAQAIVRDGEGATKFVTIEVDGGRTVAECKAVGYAIANSPLVKTAFFASDPNLGRLLCAIGFAGIAELDVERVSLYLDDVLVADQGGRHPDYQEEQGQTILQKPEFKVRVCLHRGEASTRLWTCDLSHEYVRINADYRS